MKKLIFIPLLILTLIGVSAWIWTASEPIIFHSSAVGIGQSSPTAYLHIKAGTADPSTAPLKLTAGTLLATPEAGTMEYDGTRWYIYGTNRRIISRAGDSIVTPVTVANTTDETTLWSGTLGANTLNANKVYRINTFGSFGTHDAADTVTVRLKVNGTALVTLASTAGVVSDKPWHGLITITCRTTGATGTISSHGEILLNTTSLHQNTDSTVINTTTSNAITVTAQWDAADAANTLTIDQGYMEVMD